MKYSDIMKAKRNELTDRFPCIGAGSSRYVFDAGNGTVIKCAKRNGKGVEQNETEYDLCQHLSGDVGILCPVLDISDDGRILIMKKCVPFKRNLFMSDRAKKVANNFLKRLKEFEEYYHSKKCPLPTSKFYGYGKSMTEQKIKSIRNNPVFQDICTLTLDYNIIEGDIFRANSWGLYGSKVVLLDYGCTKECYDRLYMRCV